MHLFLQRNSIATLLIKKTDFKIVLLKFRKPNKNLSFITIIICIFYFKYINHVQYQYRDVYFKAVAFNFVLDMTFYRKYIYVLNICSQNKNISFMFRKPMLWTESHILVLIRENLPVRALASSTWYSRTWAILEEHSC